jgi:hypothetical protein
MEGNNNSSDTSNNNINNSNNNNKTDHKTAEDTSVNNELKRDDLHIEQNNDFGDSKEFQEKLESNLHNLVYKLFCIVH